MIDIHTHVLPAVDDGPESLEQAIENISALCSGGTEIVVATPHNMPGMFETPLDRIVQSYEATRDALTSAGMPVKLILAQEITFQPELLEKLERRELLPIGDTDYFLFEFPPYTVSPQARDFIFEARIKGYTPILAHPERNSRLQDDLDLVEKFVEGGALMQLTASSIFGRLGEQAQKSSLLMLRRGLAHFIATDCHSFRFGPGDMTQAVNIAAEITDYETAKSLVEDNPRAVVENRPLAQ